ncbi:hypothetical protein HMPREF2559_08585 [Corynebacterium sp. HMSC072G08]|uniref:Secreted protein n=1 Tax=Corynebacterium phoceense TaxID=1686286 RepID=A0A540R9J6_9CORY|nr:MULTISPECIES: hypothetical protein [Corynebacterium]OFN44713.1 hypothetical protein HMPREF2559_08585 [Corynebacterium sp. HMSC072G08]TQE44408.1 hypothetical protein EJK80_02170 [Corynebacterium phoceense]
MRRISQALTATILATALTVSSPALAHAQTAPVIQSVELKADNDASSAAKDTAIGIVAAILFIGALFLGAHANNAMLARNAQ